MKPLNQLWVTDGFAHSQAIQDVTGMKFAYWLINNEICARPGPNEEPWDVQDLYAHGIRAVLSVNKGDGVVSRDLTRLGINYKRVSLPVNTPPTAKDLKASLKLLARAYNFAVQQVDDGRPLLVHCRHGNDRTGVFLAYYLSKRHGYSPEGAIEEIRSRRAACLRANGWQRFTLELLRQANTSENLPS